MFRKRILAFLILISFPIWISCSSTDPAEEGEQSVADEIAEEVGGEDVADIDTGEDDDEFDDEFGDEFDDEFDDEDGGDEFADEDDDDMEDEFAEVEEEDFEDDEFDDEDDEEELAGEDDEDDEEMVAEETLSDQDELAAQPVEEANDVMDEEDMVDSDMQESGMGWIPVKKIALMPFRKNGGLLNSVYILREGDSLHSVSQKIFGVDRTDEILAYNPHLRNTTRPGNKLYYNSPNRPTDANSMMTYYEDKGIPAEVYTTSEGDNIREVSAGLLGFEGAWKEIWATNAVESKQFVSGGIPLRYWKSDAVVGPTLASTEAPAPANESFEPEAINEPPEMLVPPDPVIAEPVGMEAAPAPIASLPPPPPPPPEATPNPVLRDMPSSRSSSIGGDSSTLALGAVAVILLGGIVYLAVQKKNRKRLDFEYTTQA